MARLGMESGMASALVSETVLGLASEMKSAAVLRMAKVVAALVMPRLVSEMWSAIESGRPSADISVLL